MIHSVRGRAAFRDLRRHGRRASSGPFWIQFHADASPNPRLALAISRTVGNAVVRNRARRQIRAVMAELRAQRPELLPAGDYLVGAGRAPFDSSEARQCLTAALQELSAP